MLTSILTSFAVASAVRTFAAGAVLSATVFTTLKKTGKK